MLKSANYIYENNIIADETNTTKQHCKKAQVGVDCTLKEVYKIKGFGRIYSDKSVIPDYTLVDKISIGCDKTGWILDQGTYIVKLNEGVQFGPNDTGWFYQRSSLNRSGAEIISSVWDPGFTTQFGDKIEAPTLRLNVHADKIIIEENARIAQLVVFENEDTTQYDGQFQGGRTKSKLED